MPGGPPGPPAPGARLVPDGPPPGAVGEPRRGPAPGPPPFSNASAVPPAVVAGQSLFSAKRPERSVLLAAFRSSAFSGFGAPAHKPMASASPAARSWLEAPWVGGSWASSAGRASVCVLHGTAPKGCVACKAAKGSRAATYRICARLTGPLRHRRGDSSHTAGLVRATEGPMDRHRSARIRAQLCSRCSSRSFRSHSRSLPHRRSAARRAGRDPEQPVPAAGDAALLRLHQAGRPLRRAPAADDFRRLWDTGFLDDLGSSAATARSGKIVTFRGHGAQAHPDRGLPRAARRSPPRTSRTSSRSGTPQLRIDTFYDPAKARKVEAIIKEMLAAKGRPFATVKHEAKTVGGAGQQVSFVIDDGPKAQVKQIEFDGQRGVLRRQAARADEEDQAARASGTCPGSAARPPTPRRSGRRAGGPRATAARLRGLLPEPRLRDGARWASRRSRTWTASRASSRRSR